MVEYGKVAYNNCYGGFCLSREAILRAREISGDPKWGGATIKGDIYSNGDLVESDYGIIEKIKRHDKVLVQVVEELGSTTASGSCAEIALEVLPLGVSYHIDNYDGNETVIIDSNYWEIVE